MVVWKIYTVVLVVLELQNAQSKETIGDGVFLGDELSLKTRIAQIRQFLLPLSESHFQEVLKKTAREYIPVHAVSEECRNHSNHLLESFMRGDMWALKMLDAGSKLGSGVLDGHFQDLGNYEQCINIEVPDFHFRGQHCVVKTWGVLPTQQDSQAFFSSDVTFSVCVPSSCSVEDVATHIDHVLAPLYASTLYSASLAAGIDPSSQPSLIDCSSGEPPAFRFRDYVATVAISVIVAATLVCTYLEPRYGSRYSPYSLRSNFQGLMNTKPSVTEISCLNGLRVLFIVLLLMYQRFFMSLMALPTFRQKTVLDEFESSTVIFLETIKPCLDVFFMIGGTVLSYSFFQNRQKHQAFNLLHFYAKRYFRLTPMLAAVMVLYATVLLHLTRGPVWAGKVAEFWQNPCNDYWWAGLLHISNYYVSETLCVAQSWYLACDFQFHLFAPLLLFPLHKRPRLGWILLAVCFTLPILTKLVYSYVNELYPESVYNEHVKVRDTDGSNNRDYRGFHYRAPGFVLGITLGYVLFMVKQKRESFKFSKPFFLFGWIVAINVLFASHSLTKMVISPEHEFSPWIDPFFNALTKPLFCGCFAWIIFACSLGYGGFLNQFLCWRGFRPLAKLTFGVYLVHEIVLGAQLFSVQVPFAFSHLHFWCSLCGDLVVSFSLSAVLYLLVEVPFFALALNILKGKEKSENIEKQMQMMSDHTITMQTTAK